jgi:hypothetical protein
MGHAEPYAVGLISKLHRILAVQTPGGFKFEWRGK